MVDRPNHVYVMSADGTGTPRNLTPGPHHHGGISWLPDSSAIVTGAARHDGWDLDLAVDVYVVPLDGEPRALTSQTGQYALPSVSPDGTRVALLGIDDPMLEPQNASVGIIAIDGGAITWISSAIDRHWQPYGSARQPIWTDDNTLIAVVEDRGETHLYELAADGSRDLRRRSPRARSPCKASMPPVGRWRWPRQPCNVPPSCSRSTARSRRLTRSWSDWEKFTVPCTDGSDEIDAWIMRPEGLR